MSHKNKEEQKSSKTIPKIESITENLPTKKIPGPDGFLGEFHQTVKEEINLSLQKVFQRTLKKKKRGIFSPSHLNGTHI